MKRSEKKNLKILPLRRISQISIILLIIAVPLYSQNPYNGSPSLIVKGQLPPPAISKVSGDTWSFSIGNFNIIHPAAFFDFVFSAKSVSSSMLIAVLIPLLITLLFGRVFCSWLCPIGFILELSTKINAILKKKGFTRKIYIRNFRYIILAVSLLTALLLGIPIISIFDPAHLLGRELSMIFTHQEVSVAGLIFLLAILVFEILFVSRAWCRFFCPSGACLSLIGVNRNFKIRTDQKECVNCNLCRSVCSYNLEPDKIVNYTTLQRAVCDNCGLCRDSCPKGAISYDFCI
ncbi:MAG: 4Fe-4S binding protein [Pseudomonadota bacterium]